jgi:hypothetical protein
MAAAIAAMWVGASETVSKPGTVLGAGIGIGSGFCERHSEQELFRFRYRLPCCARLIVSDA